MPPPRVSVFIDGACTNNHHRDASKRRAGIGIYWGPDHALNTSQRVPAQHRASNQTAELFALLVALQQAALQGVALRSMDVYTDSMFCINCATKWMTGWAARGWRKTDGEPVIHRDILAPIHELLMHEGRLLEGFRMHHVRAHRRLAPGATTHERFLWQGNRVADLLAVRATAS